MDASEIYSKRLNAKEVIFSKDNGKHRVLNEGSESRHSHRYSIAIQHFATQWSQSYPCRTTTSQETARAVGKAESHLPLRPKVLQI